MSCHSFWVILEWAVQGGDVVSSAPELARLTLNVATVHHDATVDHGCTP